jgi:hypothetical protein
LERVAQVAGGHAVAFHGYQLNPGASRPVVLTYSV